MGPTKEDDIKYRNGDSNSVVNNSRVFAAERAEGATKAAAQAKGHEERTGP